MKDLFAAVCLVAVLEGLFLFVAPFAWKRMAERLLDLPSPALRSFGGAGAAGRPEPAVVGAPLAG